MDAVKMLTEEHRAFDELFKRYLAARTPTLREDLARRLLHEARLHIALEEKYIYPIAIERSDVPLDEHRQAKFSLAELEKLAVDDPGFEERLGTFVKQLLQHSHEEERVFFAALRKTMVRSELAALGRLLQNAREERPPELIPEGLVARAARHLVTTWKAQLCDSVEKAVTALLGLSGPHSPGTTNS